MKTNKSLLQKMTSLSALLLLTSTLHSETIGYWRMEQDDDPGIGYSITNEAGYAPLTGTSGGVDTGKADSVMTDTLENTLANTGSLAGGSATDGVDINGTINSYTSLNSESITVEFFARTDEGMAGFITRSTGSNGQSAGSDGIAIYGPNSINVRFYTVTNNVIVTNDLSGVYNTDYDWDYHAFTYDAASGIATYYINGMIWRLMDGPDNAPLYWGPSNTVIKVGSGMDGNALKDQDKGIMDELRISNTALSPEDLLYKPVIARDSFAITPQPWDYHEARIYQDADNQKAVLGTVGFSVDRQWSGNANTSNLEVRDDSPDGSELNHTLLADELKGAVRLKAKDPRDQRRQLSVTVPTAPEYYMCALLHATGREPNENLSMGFSDSPTNRNKGIHVGFNDGRLAVFAGGTAFDIMSTPYDLNITYLVVLRLTVNTSGTTDTIEAYLAEEGAETIDLRKVIEVDTFSDPADLGYLKFVIIRNDYSDQRYWWMDEPRLATTAAALGIDPSLMVVQPPAETIFLLQ